MLTAILLAAAPFTCTVTSVHDADTFTCAGGKKVRVAGIQAPDFADTAPCRAGRAEYVCSDRAARASQRVVSAMVLHRRLACEGIEPSYARIVARCQLPDGRDLSCAVIAAGAATRWDRYWRRYKFAPCPAPRGGRAQQP